MSAPVRADLAAVQPLYYPIVEQSKFGSIKAMCTRLGLPEDEVQGCVARAMLEQSDMVVCDRLVLGNPEAKTCAVLVLNPGGSVMLCAGLFAELTPDAAAAKALAEEFAAHPDFKGRFVAVGEFRPNPHGALQ